MRHLIILSAAAALAAALATPARSDASQARIAASAMKADHDMSATSHDMAPVTAGDLTIAGGWAKAMLPSQPTGGAYLTITNNGGEADRLVGASSPNAAKVEIHTMEMSNNVMVMRPVEGGLEIAAGATVELKPGAHHLMFMKVSQPFKEGATVPVTLEFEKAGKVEIELPVMPASGKPGHGMKTDKG